jgi:chemotaxis family two-component system sensor histidine kinase/response regulator PixL
MRLAHTIKGSAASVGLDAIATLAHRLENIFNRFYDESLVVTVELESQLLRACDCLRLLLINSSTANVSSSEQVITTADSILTQIETYLGPISPQIQSYIPSSVEQGENMLVSIFEIDVAQGLDHLARVIAHPEAYDVIEELHTQLDVFANFAQMFELPGFAAIIELVRNAIGAAPHRAVEIAKAALIEFEQSRQTVLAGDRSQGGQPSEALIKLTEHLFNLNSASLTNAPLSLDPSSASIAPPQSTAEIHHLPLDSPATPAPSEHLPSGSSLARLQPYPDQTASDQHFVELHNPIQDPLSWRKAQPAPEVPDGSNSLTVRVDTTILERINNLVGELAINQDGLLLQNEQLQATLNRLKSRFEQFRSKLNQMEDWSHQFLVAPEQNSEQHSGQARRSPQFQPTVPHLEISADPASPLQFAEFDALELDQYGRLHTQLQAVLEEVAQIEEAFEDVNFLAQQSQQWLTQQRYTLSYLRDDLSQARMVPVGEVLNRFPRILRDLSATYHKPIRLNLIGTEVLVDKAILERLYEPLLHLLRNAFDHGIEDPVLRQHQQKLEEGLIEVKAYHKGNQTIIEVRDDGRGIDLEQIRRRAFELAWLPFDQLALASGEDLLKLIFEPGFSTLRQATELSGRGIGLDVVRSQLHKIRGTIAVTSTAGQGTTFSVTLPVSLITTNLLLCIAGPSAFALPTEGIQEIVTPKPEQIRQAGMQRFIAWRQKILPVYRLADFLTYHCPIVTNPLRRSLGTVDPPKSSMLPLLILDYNQAFIAIEIDRVFTEQEFVVKPFNALLTPPDYIYGCTVLGDGSLVPVLDVIALFSGVIAVASSSTHPGQANAPRALALPSSQRVTLPQVPTILVIDDAVTLRRTLALALERAGYRVLQARDGWEAIEQMQQGSAVNLIISDIEMPRMNGFEFLNYRRQNADLAEVPVVILTSRSNEKHRQLALQLGATTYFSKPYLAHQFLAAIADILQANAMESAAP